MNNDEQKNKRDKVLMGTLTPEEYHVTQEKGTEAPFSGKYVDNHQKGVYLCKVCGAPLFSSLSKFD